MPINSFSPPRIVIDTNSPVHAESSPHVRRTLDINRESDIHAVAGTPQTPISIHALRKESDPGTLRLTKRSKNFNPHSLRGATESTGTFNQKSEFQSTLPCGERRYGKAVEQTVWEFQSTLLAGSDNTPTGTLVSRSNFNPHSLAGSDEAGAGRPREGGCNFNPHSLRGATRSYVDVTSITNFNPHSLAGSDHLHAKVHLACDISIHTPCGERPDGKGLPMIQVFQSTLLAGSDGHRRMPYMFGMFISIHTPLAGSDKRHVGLYRGDYISIHTPLAGSDF